MPIMAKAINDQLDETDVFKEIMSNSFEADQNGNTINKQDQD